MTAVAEQYLFPKEETQFAKFGNKNAQERACY